MGLKKPVKTGSALPTLNELTGVDVAPVETDGYIVLDTVPGQACAMESNTPISIKAELGKFGDATAADVASGKTFTSADGLKVTGSLVPYDPGAISMTKHDSGYYIASSYKTMAVTTNFILIASSDSSVSDDTTDIMMRINNTVKYYSPYGILNSSKCTISGNTLTIKKKSGITGVNYLLVDLG